MSGFSELANRCEKDLRGSRTKEQYRTAINYYRLARKHLSDHENHQLRRIAWDEGIRFMWL